MYSIRDFINTPSSIKSYVEAFKSSEIRRNMIVARDYYEGNNTTINKVKKLVAVQTEMGYQSRENFFVSNYKIANNFVQDLVDQKVYGLLEKTPKVTGLNEVAEMLTDKLDYAMQTLAVNSSLSGVGFAYVELQNNTLKFKPFKSEQCVPFFDDVTDELKALIRFWENTSLLTQERAEFYEVYEEGMYTLYKFDSEGDSAVMVEQTSYLVDRHTTLNETTEVGRNWVSGLPIITLKNNAEMTSDFTKSIRSQIDSIDIVLSDFANNLSDFQDVFWIIKGLDEITAEEMGDFMGTIKSTYKANLPEGVEIDTKQIEIPHDAKMVFVEKLSKQLVNNCGVLDTSLVMTGSQTATAIKVASQKLMLRISKFEYEVFETMLNALKFIKEFAKDNSVYNEIKFFKTGLNNDTELIDNLTKSLPNISLETYLENHPYIEDVELELERLEKEEDKTSLKLVPKLTEEDTSEDEEELEEDIEVEDEEV